MPDMPRRDDGEVICSRACMGEPPPDPLGRDHSYRLWQKTGAVGEGGSAHPHDTLRGALDHCDKEAGRDE